MARLIKMQCDETEIWVEVEEVGTTQSLKDLGGVEAAQKVVASFEKISETIRAFCRSLVTSFREMEQKTAPHKITAEFGLKISGEGQVFVVKSTAEASLKITAEWELERKA